MSDATTNLLLPYILAAQAQKHVTHNEALRVLDAAGKLVLPQASGLAGGSHDVADLGGGEVASGHDIYRTVKYY